MYLGKRETEEKKTQIEFFTTKYTNQLNGMDVVIDISIETIVTFYFNETKQNQIIEEKNCFACAKQKQGTNKLPIHVFFIEIYARLILIESLLCCR